MYAEGLSDHSPCSLVLHWKETIATSKPRHRSHWCSHFFVKQQCITMFSRIDFDTVEVEEALSVAKSTFRQAALFLRDHSM